MTINGMDTSGKDESTGQVINPSYLLSQLNHFLSLAAPYSGSERWGSAYNRVDAAYLGEEEERTACRIALFLLKNLPPARPAALTFLAQVLSKEVVIHIQRGKENGNEAKDSEESLTSQLENLLGELVEVAPLVWGPLVAGWAVEQLARWAADWGNSVVGRPDATLEEIVAGWLNCPPARTLAMLTISCVTHNPDETVYALLDASGHSGPALDWLVAHVGCSFPATVIGRVLILGLKSFAKTSNLSANSQKLGSVNTILDHLADRHLSEIQRGLHSILLMIFSGKNDEETIAAVPYLLQLASTSRSRAILTALTTILPPLLEPPGHLTILASQMPKWIGRYFSSTNHILDLVVHLLLDTSGRAAPGLMKLLLVGSIPSPNLPDTITHAFNVVLHSLLNELCNFAYMKRANGNSKPRVPLLAGLAGEGREESGLQSRMLMSSTAVLPVNQLMDWAILSEDVGIRAVRQVGQLLNLLVFQQGPASSTTLLLHLLHVDKKFLHQNHLHLLVQVLSAVVNQQSCSNKSNKILPAALATSFEESAGLESIHNSINCLETLLIGSRHLNNSVITPLTDALLINIPILAHLVSIETVSSSVMHLLGNLPLDRPLPLSHIQCLSHTTVFYFLSALKNEDISAKVAVAAQCDKVLSQLSQSSLAHSLLVRLFVEAAFKPEWSYLFGSASNTYSKIDDSKESLFEINNKFDSWVKLPLSHTSIFHAGIIGKGNKKKIRSNLVLSDESISLNTQLFLNLMGTCCRMQGAHQGATTIALLLVELISPDIMFNGFPWPEENIKFTFERDLAIRKTFEEYPIAWHLLEIIARCRPALCYCSVLVRALTAALTAHWNTCPLSSSRQSPTYLSSTKRLLEIMSIGQFLSGALSVLPQMVDELAPYEIVGILQDVWAYLRDHTPSPDRWTQLPSGVYHRPPDPPDSRYTERCRHLVEVHVETLGHLLPAIINSRS